MGRYQMISIFGKQRRRQARWCSLAACGWALAMFVILHAWSIDLATAQSSAPQAYRITAGDKIGVTVFGQPDLSSESTVDQSGNLRLPIVGDIYAVNLTLSELERSIARALAQGYVRNPTVSVKIAEFGPIYVLGMVRTPGLYPYREGLSVLGAIARAGGIGAVRKPRRARRFVAGRRTCSPTGNQPYGPPCKTGAANRTAERR